MKKNGKEEKQSPKVEVSAYKLDSDTYGFHCPYCDNLTEVEDSFVWKNSRNEMIRDCDHCKKGNNFVVIKK